MIEVSLRDIETDSDSPSTYDCVVNCESFDDALEKALEAYESKYGCEIIEYTCALRPIEDEDETWPVINDENQ